MTAEQLRAKFPHASEAFIRQNCGQAKENRPFTGAPGGQALAIQNGLRFKPVRSKRKRQDGYDSQLEADWSMVLTQRYGGSWRHHGITLRLPIRDNKGRIRFDKYTPDFVAWKRYVPLELNPPRVILFECKGNHCYRRAGVERFKRFAEQTPWARFVLVERGNGVWKETEV